MEYTLIFYTQNGNKVIIKPLLDTHFGQINHQWSYSKDKNAIWTAFNPRLTRIELTLENLNAYFSEIEKVKVE